LLFTKVDETVEPGGMINLALGKGCPISYLCDGQNIPDDLMIASGQSLTQFFFNKS
jgi:flagellar biosynthesis protein FlhF